MKLKKRLTVNFVFSYENLSLVWRCCQAFFIFGFTVLDDDFFYVDLFLFRVLLLRGGDFAIVVKRIWHLGFGHLPIRLNSLNLEV